MQLSQFLIEPDASIMEAMSRLDNSDHKILYVVNRESQLLGAVTDGDVRRYILKNQSIAGNVSQVMYKKVRYLTKDSSVAPSDYMKAQELQSIPIVDSEKRVVAVEFFAGSKYYKSSKINLPVVIMAGGNGTR